MHPSFQGKHIGAQTERCFTLINSTPPSIGICNISSDFSHFLLRFQQACERQIGNTIPLPKSTNTNTILTEFGIVPPRNAQVVVVREREREREREIAFGLEPGEGLGFGSTLWLALLPRAHRIETQAALRDQRNCKAFLCCSSLYVCLLPMSVHCLLLMVCLPKNVDLISPEKSKVWRRSMLDAVPPPLGFYVIKQHDLIGSCSAVPARQREKLWREFFLDPTQWWDHRSEKVTEHQTCQSAHVNGVIALVGVNLIALSSLISCPGLNSAEIIFRSFALVG